MTVGVAIVDIAEIMKSNEDLKNVSIQLLHPATRQQVGIMRVTVEILQSLRYFYKKKA